MNIIAKGGSTALFRYEVAVQRRAPCGRSTPKDSHCWILKRSPRTSTIYLDVYIVIRKPFSHMIHLVRS